MLRPKCGPFLLQVRSRVFALTVEGVDCVVMAPFVDMVNHSFSSNASVTWAQPSQISLRAKTHIPAGAEVLINYGAKTNVELMTTYGFTVPSNPHDEIQAALQGSIRDERGVSAQSLLSVLGMEGDIDKGYIRLVSNSSYASKLWDQQEKKNLLISAARSIPRRAVADTNGEVALTLFS